MRKGHLDCCIDEFLCKVVLFGKTAHSGNADNLLFDEISQDIFKSKLITTSSATALQAEFVVSHT